MKISFWTINLNTGDGSYETLHYQTKPQALKAAKNNNESQGEEWNDRPFSTCIDIDSTGLIKLSKSAKEYLEEL